MRSAQAHKEFGAVVGGILGAVMGKWLRSSLRMEIAQALAWHAPLDGPATSAATVAPSSTFSPWAAPEPAPEPARSPLIGDRPPLAPQTIADRDEPVEPSPVALLLGKARAWLLGGEAKSPVVLFTYFTILKRLRSGRSAPAR